MFNLLPRRLTFIIISNLLFLSYIHAQDFSNKGTDFWITYPIHIDGTNSAMGIYITSDINATGNISVADKNIPFTVTANTVTRKFLGPNGSGDAPNYNVYLTQVDGIASGAAIHVTSDTPVVVYAHIIKSARSGATLVLPSNVWGRQYVVPSYYNVGSQAGEDYGYGTITVVAADTNTIVQITPTANSRNGARTAGTPFQITIPNPGDVYQIQFQQNADISGTQVESVSSGIAGCKRIAVYSSTSWSSYGCSTASSGDNLYQELFPTGAWGKSFITAPFVNRPFDIIRIFVLDPTTVVNVTENGVTQTLTGLASNSFYQYSSGNPLQINADKVISVAQYMITQGCDTRNPSNCGSTYACPYQGDPEMVILNPIEQTINNITVFSAHQDWVPVGQSNVDQCFLNIILPTSSVSSFTINGAAPVSTFIPITGTTYSYLQEDVTARSIINPVQTLKADSSFIAIAYGYGQVESYGYNAGTNVIDLSQYLSVQNPYPSTLFNSTTCLGTTFKIANILPFQPTSITWNFGNNPYLSPDTSVTINNPVADSSFVWGGSTLYMYRIPGNYTLSALGTFPVNLTTNNPTSDGCPGIQTLNYSIKVVAPITANFVYTSTGCLSDSVHFVDSSNGNGQQLVNWVWHFGNGTTDSVENPAKLYSVAGNYLDTLRAINAIGCYADTVKTVPLSTTPIVQFNVSDTTCVNGTVTFTDLSSINVGTLVKWYWDYGNGNKDTLTTNTPRTQVYATAGNYTVSLTVESNTGCRNALQKTITINATPVVGFTLPEICLHDSYAQFTDTSTIADGTESQFTYLWNFGDPNATVANPNTSILQNPTHKYTAAAYYTVSLRVASNKGCIASITQPFTVNGAIPKAGFQLINTGTMCSNLPVQIQNTSTVDFGSITKVEIYWDYINYPNQVFIDDTPSYNKIYTNQYTNFQQPLSKNVQIHYLAYSGITCVSTKDTVITLTASPSVQFTTIPGICNNASDRQITQATETGNVPGIYTFYGTGISPTGIFSPQSVTPGTDTLKYVYTSTEGCKDSATQTIVVWPIPVAQWGVSYPTCIDNNITFTDTSVANVGKITSRYWSFGDGTSSTKTNATPFTKQYSSPQIYTVSLRVLTDSGCYSNYNTREITVHDLPDVQFTLPIVCMPVGAAQFQSTSTISDGSESLFQYLWNFGDVTNNTSTIKNPLHYYSAFQSYTVTLVVTSKDGCIDSLTQQLTTVYPPPIANFTVQPGEVCMGGTINFIDASQGTPSPIQQWNWNLSQGYTSTQKDTYRAFADSGIYKISLEVFDANGCTDTKDSSVTIDPLPSLSLPHILYVLQEGKGQINPTYYGHDLQFLWTPSYFLSSTTASNPYVIEPQFDLTYTLQLTGYGDCSVTDTIFVEVLLKPIIPNAFSPNGDGINDNWQIQYLNTYPGCVVDVFDRNGQKIFHSYGYNNPWDGTYNGSPVPIGTYYYVIDPKNGRNKMTGWVEVLR